MKFTKSQIQAIESPPNNIQLIACAGSGKTEVVAQEEPQRVELVWPRKRKEAERVVLPFQRIEIVNESRATREAEKAMPLTRGLAAKSLLDMGTGLYATLRRDSGLFTLVNKVLKL